MNIQWYPGHMAKAKRMLYDHLRLVDMVIELLDARIPRSSHNPDIEGLLQTKDLIVILNKSDLADSHTLSLWKNWYRERGVDALSFVSTQRHGNKEAMKHIQQIVQRKVDHLRETKGIYKTIRAMVVGIPNVGKSTFINQLAGSNRAKTGNKPGVTKGKQWIKIGPYFEIMDSPGLLWPKFEDVETAKHLAYIGTIKDELMDPIELCISLLLELRQIYPDGVLHRYNLDLFPEDGYRTLEEICRKRGWIMSGGLPDLERGAKTIIDEFRSMKLGRVSLEKP